MSWKLKFGVCHEKVKCINSFDGNLLIANGAEFPRTGSGVKIAKKK